jgi:hypothetical protein
MTMKGSQPAAHEEPDAEADHGDADGEIDEMLAGKRDRRAADTTGQFAKGDDRTRKRDRTDKGADEKLELVAGRNHRRQAERFRIVDRGHRNQHRRQADQRVKRRDQLGHLRHLHAPRDDRADRAADYDSRENHADVFGVRINEGKRHHDGDRHADDAEQVAAARCRRVRESP